MVLQTKTLQKFIKAVDFTLEKVERSDDQTYFLVRDTLYQRSYKVNESIYQFLTLLESAFTLEEIFTHLGIADIHSEEALSFLQFFEDLQEKELIVTEEHNEHIKTSLETFTLPDVNLPQFEILKTFKHTISLFVGLVRFVDPLQNKSLGIEQETTIDTQPFIVKKLLFRETITEEEKRGDWQIFEQEIALMKELEPFHNFPKLLFYNAEEYLMAIEYIDGVGVHKYVQTQQLDLASRLILIEKILQIFVELESIGIIHGDIHASNILVDTFGKPYLIDFGLSNHTEIAGNEVIRKGGVYLYLPPERISDQAFKIINQERADIVSEIYQMGVLIYLILYHQFPFEALTWSEVSEKILNESPAFPLQIDHGKSNQVKRDHDEFDEREINSREALPSGIIELLQKLLEKNPQKRPQSFSALLAEWQQAILPAMNDEKPLE
ncbi:serine/threonine protein kinase [Ignatzschineria sp. LJL83]